ncbi:MAG TPA: hypothetical protein VIQ81_06345 [Gammaproteobacteria bacterium]
MKLILQAFSAILLTVTMQVSQAAEETGLILYYDEYESSAGGQRMRYLINDDFLRIDNGHIDSDFILMDRAKQTIYNVNHEDRTILKITNKPWQSPDYDFMVSVREALQADAPKVMGQDVYSYDVYAEDEACTRVLLIKDRYMEEMAVMHEYQTIMSGQQVSTLANTPQEMHTNCFLLDQVYHTGDYYKQGLPIQVTYSRDYTRILSNIEQQALDAALFKLPQNYKEYQAFSQ